MCICIIQVLDSELDLRTVKYSIWRSGGDVRLMYREKKEESVIIEDTVATVQPSLQQTNDLAAND